jgi:hypothetical protein
MKNILLLSLLFVASTGFAQLVVVPVFSIQPVGKTVAIGSNYTFNSAASGAPTYQWRKDGLALNGATRSFLALANINGSNIGKYSVVATNSAGSATSNEAVLAVSGAVPTSTTFSDGWLSVSGDSTATDPAKVYMPAATSIRSTVRPTVVTITLGAVWSITFKPPTYQGDIRQALESFTSAMALEASSGKVLTDAEKVQREYVRRYLLAANRPAPIN